MVRDQTIQVVKRSNDFQLMLNGCMLGRYSAPYLSKMLRKHIVLGCTKCIPQGGVQHMFKVSENRLYFSAKVMLGDNRLYVYFSTQGGTTVYIQDAKTISEGEFMNNELINRVLSYSVETIEREAFSRCYNLKKMKMPNLISVHPTAFQYCNDVEMVAPKLYIAPNNVILFGRLKRRNDSVRSAGKRARRLIDSMIKLRF